MSKNNKVKYLHIFPDVLFFEPYVDFINKNFNSGDHLFLILTNREKINLSRNAKKISKNFKDLSILIRALSKSEKVILHGLINYQLVLILFFQPWLLKKCYWVIFGVDLYFYKLRKKNLKSSIYEIARRVVIKNMNGIIALIKEEYELAQKWYGAKGKYYYSFLYPNGIYKEINLLKVKKNNKKIYIQVGHSADPALNHLKVFQKLEKYKDKAIEIICPLAYGYEDYRNKIIQEGLKIFGKKFKPIIELLPQEKYRELLAKIDVAIFDFQGQLAGYNILFLLGLGKKVYIRDNVTFWKFYNDLGLKVYNYNNLDDELFEKVPDEIKLKNINIIKNHFTEERLKEDWEKIFQSK